MEGIQSMNNPKVSIIIPVYNGEKFLEETIESCLKQDYENKEIIVIDDCSTDSSVGILEQYENIIEIKNEKNLGLNRSVNKAVNCSSGEYLLFLGHDDKLKHDHVSKIISEFDLNTVVVYCNSIIIDENSNEKYVTYNKDNERKNIKNIRFEIAKRNIISSTGLIMRKKSFLDVGGFNENFRNYGEWHLWIKLLGKGNCKYSSQSKAYYRKHTTNISNTFTNKNIKEELIKYFNYSRKEAYNSFYKEFSLVEKFKYTSYCKYTNVKSYLSLQLKK